MPAFSASLLLSTALAAAPAPDAHAVAAADPAPADQAGPAAQSAPDEVIVTGTRAQGRTVASSLAPIDVLGKADLQTSGKQSVRDLLGTLVPSISISNSGAGASFAVKTLSLRGLSGDQVLVLVNGKRRHNTATLFINGTTQNGQSPPDLDLIPTSAIERVEVLRDGASAQYGSDAIAGVINLILKSDASISASMLGGATRNGGGEQARALGDFGVAFGEGGHIHVAADGYLQGRTVRGQANTSVLYPLVGGAADPREATANRYVNKPGQPQVTGINTSYDAALPLGTGSGIGAYSFGTWSDRHSDAWLTFRNPNAAGNILQIYPDGYIPHLRIHDRDMQAAIGVKGDGPGALHFDLSTSYAINRVDYVETTALNASLGPASPTTFYIGQVKATQWTSNLDLSRRFDLGLAEPLLVAAGAEYRRDSYAIFAGEPASYTDGGYRSPAGQPLAGTIRQAGSQGVTGFPPSAAGMFARHNYSLYLDLEQKIVEGLEVAIAGRHEDYSDFGTTNTGKASIRFAPFHWLALRGTASTGFRAPTLQQEHYASSSTIGVLLPGAVTTVLAPVRALPVNDPAAIALGATSLRPEDSTSYSAGLVLTPAPPLNLTVDAYQIDIRHRILLTGTFTGSAIGVVGGVTTYNAVGTLLKNAGLDPNQSGFYFTNAASTRSKGLDVVGTYRADLGRFGAATFTLSANFSGTHFLSIDTPAVLANAGLSVIGRARRGDFTRGTPDNKEIANIYYTVGAFSMNLRGTRYGKVTQVADAIAANGIYNDDTIDPKIITDLELSYALNKTVKLTLGSNNLFNIYPTVLSPVNQGNTGFAYYNPYSPYGISGGFYYGKVSFSF